MSLIDIYFQSGELSPKSAEVNETLINAAISLFSALIGGFFALWGVRLTANNEAQKSLTEKAERQQEKFAFLRQLSASCINDLNEQVGALEDFVTQSEERSMRIPQLVIANRYNFERLVKTLDHEAHYHAFLSCSKASDKAEVFFKLIRHFDIVYSSFSTWLNGFREDRITNLNQAKEHGEMVGKILRQTVELLRKPEIKSHKELSDRLNATIVSYYQGTAENETSSLPPRDGISFESMFSTPLRHFLIPYSKTSDDIFSLVISLRETTEKYSAALHLKNSFTAKTKEFTTALKEYCAKLESDNKSAFAE